MCGRRIPSGGRAGFLADHRFTGEVARYWLRPGEPCPGSGCFADDLWADGGVPQWTRDRNTSDVEWVDQMFNKDEYDPYRCKCGGYDSHILPRGPNGRFGANPQAKIPATTAPP